MNEINLRYQEDENHFAEFIDCEMSDKQHQAEIEVMKRYGARDHKMLTRVIAFGAYQDDKEAQRLWDSLDLNDLHMYAVLDYVDEYKKAYHEDAENQFDFYDF